MATHVRNFVRAFGNFIRAFCARWWVEMTFLSGVPLTFGNYFVSAGGGPGFIFPMAGLGIMVFASFLVWKAENDARLKAEALVYHPLIDIKQSSLFLDPPEYEVWKAKIIPTKSVKNMQVCVDFVADSGGVGPNSKRPKRRLVLRGNADFVLGAEVPIDLMEQHHNSSGMPFWSWATTGESLVFTCHSCQLVFISAQEPPDYLDFIVDFHYEEKLSRDGKTPPRYEKTPSLIGERRFLYAREWKNDGK